MAAIDGLSVKRQPKEGQVIKTQMKADLEIGGQAATFTGVVQTKTLKVEADGTYSEEEQQLSGKAKFGDQEMDVPDSGPRTTVYNPDGTIKEIRGQGDANTLASEYRMAALSSLIDAAKPLSVGDTWNYNFKADPKTGAVDAVATYKVIGEEKVDTFDTIKLHVTVKESGGSDGASSEGDWWIDKTDGSLVKGDAKWVNAPFPGAPAPISAHVVLTRLAN